MKKKANLMLIRDGFLVRRYHTVGHLVREETVGHHTANVIALLFFLFDDEPPLEVIKYALHHDVAEAITGDVPATAKWEEPALAKVLAEMEKKIHQNNDLSLELPPHLEPIFKFADMADLCLKCVDEMVSGNQFFAEMLGRGMIYLRGLLKGALADHRAAQEVFKMIQNNPLIFVEVIERDQAQKDAPPQGKTH